MMTTYSYYFYLIINTISQVMKVKLSKVENHFLLAALTFVGLLMLLIIQVVYSFKAATLEERNFNHLVVMAMKDARNDIGKQANTCNKMNDYLCGNSCGSAAKHDSHTRIDSIINANLKAYHLPLNYRFTVSDSVRFENSSSFFGPKCYHQTLNGLLQQSGIDIRLQFPDRNRFIMAQMSGLFLVSILIILFVLGAFVTLLRVIKQKKEQVSRTTDFVNNLLHELQTPLANIRLAANLMKKKMSVNDYSKTQEYSEVILSEYEKMQQHVDGVLKLTCPSSGGGWEPIDLKFVLEELGASFSYRINERNGILELVLGDQPLWVNSFNGQLALAVSNLIDNAIKYSPETVHIRISCELKKEQLVLQVSDTGMGIPEKDLPLIFDRYYRVGTGDVHNVKGFGLGLTFVKKVIESHKGTVHVTSQLHKGTLFTIILPLATTTKQT